jgi:hypothetical protein
MSQSTDSVTNYARPFKKIGRGEIFFYPHILPELSTFVYVPGKRCALCEYKYIRKRIARIWGLT